MRFLLAVCLIVGLWGCGNNEDDKPSANGNPDDLMVVVADQVWTGPVGDILKKVYTSPLRGLPQDEARFNLMKINPLKFNRVLRNSANILFVITLENAGKQSEKARSFFTDESLKKIKSDTSEYLTVVKDKFAKGQRVVFVYAETAEQLARQLADNEQYLLSLFEDRTRELMRQRLLKSREKALEKQIRKNHGYSIQIPFGWDKAKDTKDFLWLRELGTNREKNVFIYETPYPGPEIFEDIAGLRDQITELHLRDSEYPELYIQRQELIPVSTERVTFRGKFAIEARGLWKISDSTGGGPFISYCMVDEKNNRLYYIEGYVYNPSGKKKKLIREMEAILSTFQIPSETKK